MMIKLTYSKIHSIWKEESQLCIHSLVYFLLSEKGSVIFGNGFKFSWSPKVLVPHMRDLKKKAVSTTVI